MAPGQRQSLSRLGLVVGLLLAAGLVLAWAAPTVARLVVRTGRGGSDPRAATDPALVDQVMSQAIAAAGLRQRLAHREVDGVVQQTWQLPEGKAAAEVAEELRRSGRAAGVELHTIGRDVLDAEVRVYAGPQLRQEILLIPALAADTAPPRAPNRRERPLVALVVGGLGRRDASAIVGADVPLTVAIEPWTPYALATARDAAAAWQEIVVDLPTRGADPTQARAAVPFSSGFLVREGELDHLTELPDPGVIITPTRAFGPRAEKLLVLSAWQARDRSVDDLLARTRHLAATVGHTTMLLERDDPALPAVLQWARERAPARYRVVLASEIARPIDTIGLLDQHNPKAQGGP